MGACWNWTAGLGGVGRGKFAITHDRNVSAPHWVWRHTFGEPIFEVINQKCNNLLCVNPAHLENVTRQEIAQRLAAFITQCTLCTICQVPEWQLKITTLVLGARIPWL